MGWQYWWLVVLAWLPVSVSGSNSSCHVALSTSDVVLAGVPFLVQVGLPPFLGNSNLPNPVYYTYSEKGRANASLQQWQEVATRLDGQAHLDFSIENVQFNSVGHHTLEVNFSSTDPNITVPELFCSPEYLHVLAIPAPLTILPPIITALFAIVFRQVILALLIGIWLCAFFANGYNPGSALLRTLDTYFVHSIANSEHARVVVGTLFLGGLIGVVQKSGGGIGLARKLCQFAGTRRRASIVALVLCLLLFFDDYSCVLIAGSSLRSVMEGAGVSKEKFAFILQSIGPMVPSLVPVSGWIGVELGYVQSAFANDQCTKTCGTVDPFLIVVKSIPYRFFPLLLVLCVVIVCFLSRDFGPMLVAERASIPSLPPSSSPHPPHEVEMNESSQEESSEEEFSGPLAPKPGVPKRWFNAAVPFGVASVMTLVGMILSGIAAINHMPSPRPSLSVVNIFTYAESLNALVWSSALANAVALGLYLPQKLLSLKEFMEAWVEGIKDIMEPLIVLLLAWALGTAIQDIQTNNFFAQALRSGGISIQYIPAIVTILGFIMSFATGSAFGTMGLLFPLVIPTVCQLTPQCDEDARVQATAAILASSMLGNAISPIADITILTMATSRCPLSSHLKTAFVYVVLVAVLSLLFGSLPVGAGWLPWYAAWLLMAILLVLPFLFLSASVSSHSSLPLCKRCCPRVYALPAMLGKRVVRTLVLTLRRCLCCRHRPSEPLWQSRPNTEPAQASMETTPLLAGHDKKTQKTS